MLILSLIIHIVCHECCHEIGAPTTICDCLNRIGMSDNGYKPTYSEFFYYSCIHHLLNLEEWLVPNVSCSDF